MNFVLLIQAAVVIIIIGIVYNLWRTAQTYGGLIGEALRWIGLGILVFALEAVDRVLGSYGFVGSLGFLDSDTLHLLILGAGLLFSGIGFSKLTKLGKQ